MVHKRNLLGAPPPLALLDNDMLMHVCRDILVQKFSFNLDNYYPPEDVTQRMIEYAAYLRPHVEDFKKLGWHHVEAFSRDALLSSDAKGRKFIQSYGSFDSETIAIIAEVAFVISIYHTPSTIAQEIENDLKPTQW